MKSLFKQPYMQYVLFLAGIVFIFLWARSRKMEGFKNPPPASTPEYTFVMYYADWCPHCHRAKPEFDKLGAIQTIGGKKVKIVALEEKDIPDSVKVEGYPTIRLLDAAGKPVDDYDGERTKAGFDSYLKSKLAA